MSRPDQASKLRVLAELMLDHRLAGLKRAASAKAKSEAALVCLAQPVVKADGLLGTTAELAELTYQRWADSRRAAINQTLAQQTHDWIEAQDAARKAFGKAETLRALEQKLLKR